MPKKINSIRPTSTIVSYEFGCVQKSPSVIQGSIDRLVRGPTGPYGSEIFKILLVLRPVPNRSVRDQPILVLGSLASSIKQGRVKSSRTDPIPGDQSTTGENPNPPANQIQPPILVSQSDQPTKIDDNNNNNTEKVISKKFHEIAPRYESVDINIYGAS